ncbi:MAG: penicillin-binding protein 1C [Treponema sp.]|nr:penicillin-binding protein 1C [Treponema sp.]
MGKRSPRKRGPLYISVLLVLLLMFALALPDSLFEVSYSPVLYDSEGRLLGARVAQDGQWRFPDQGALNEMFVIALVETEDRRFFHHPGVDPIAIVRALGENFRARRVVSGASTLTMQTIRLSRGRGNRSIVEKLIEAALALRLELGHSKEEILALYAANAPFGANVVGLEAAAWRWFGRGSQDLSWAEAATLAVLPNSPGLIHPGRNRAALHSRRDALLEALHRRGHFDAETLTLSLAEPIPQEPLPLPRGAPHLLERLIMEAREPGGRTFYTTIDREIQERAGEILNRASGRFAENHIMNGAILVIDTRTGETAAYVANTNTSHGGDVDIIQARRSSGSLLKPFLYAAMLDSGDIMPSSLVSDIPTRIGSFSPENITRTYLGVVPADEALTRSLNVSAARSLRIYGVDRFARLLRSLGLSTLFREGADYGLTLILGGAEVTLWEITGLYAGLGRAVGTNWPGEGSFFPPTVFPSATRAAPLQPSPLSPGATYLTLEALVSTVRPGEEAIWQEFASSRNIAWKTGTSYGFRDAWAIGLSPEWTVGVWIGNASGEGRAELRSATTAAPVLFEVFSALDAMGWQRPGISHRDQGEGAPTQRSWFFQPSGELRSTEVCAISGYPAGVHCERIGYVDVPRHAPALGPCPFCRTVVLNEEGNLLVRLEAGSREITQERSWFVLPPAEEWYYRRWNLDYRPLPREAESRSSPAGGGNAMALFNPEPGAQVLIPRELDGREGRLVFSAAHRDEQGLIYWHLDDTYLGSTQTFHEMEARPLPGQRSITLVDGNGSTLVREFTVLSAEGAP